MRWLKENKHNHQNYQDIFQQNYTNFSLLLVHYHHLIPTAKHVIMLSYSDHKRGWNNELIFRSLNTQKTSPFTDNSNPTQLIHLSSWIFSSSCSPMLNSSQQLECVCGCEAGSRSCGSHKNIRRRYTIKQDVCELRALPFM